MFRINLNLVRQCLECHWVSTAEVDILDHGCGCIIPTLEKHRFHYISMIFFLFDFDYQTGCYNFNLRPYVLSKHITMNHTYFYFISLSFSPETGNRIQRIKLL